MQITIDINEQLMTEAANALNAQSQSRIIEIALGDFIQRQKSKKKHDVRELVGKVHIDPNYDYKKMRVGE